MPTGKPTGNGTSRLQASKKEKGVVETFCNKCSAATIAIVAAVHRRKCLSWIVLELTSTWIKQPRFVHYSRQLAPFSSLRIGVWCLMFPTNASCVLFTKTTACLCLLNAKLPRCPSYAVSHFEARTRRDIWSWSKVETPLHSKDEYNWFTLTTQQSEDVVTKPAIRQFEDNPRLTEWNSFFLPTPDRSAFAKFAWKGLLKTAIFVWTTITIPMVSSYICKHFRVTFYQRARAQKHQTKVLFGEGIDFASWTENDATESDAKSTAWPWFTCTIDRVQHLSQKSEQRSCTDEDKNASKKRTWIRYDTTHIVHLQLVHASPLGWHLIFTLSWIFWNRSIPRFQVWLTKPNND